VTRRALAGVAVALAATGPALATQPATQTEIDGIVNGINQFTTAQGYTFSGYQVNTIRVSSVDPTYAAANLTPNARYRGPVPVPQMLLTGSGSTWRVIDQGQNFCDGIGPVAVVKDLFNQSCGGGNTPTGGKAVLATATQGVTRVQLVAQRGTGNTATVYLDLQRRFSGGFQRVTERRLGRAGGFTWQTVTGPQGGTLFLNTTLGYTSAQVLRNATSYYQFFPFRVGLGFTPL
jgi:hypothetical protein